MSNLYCSFFISINIYGFIQKRSIYINIIKTLTSTEAPILELVKNAISEKSKE